MMRRRRGSKEKGKMHDIGSTAERIRDGEFWGELEALNALAAPDRLERLTDFGITASDPALIALLGKSHFVIPGTTAFECQKCGECCRYSRKVATFSYEQCLYLSESNLCTKHDRHYLVCRWFPFYVHHDPRLGDLLTIKPYCSGYGKGKPVDYAAKVREITELEREIRAEADGAVVIHEVIYLPERGEWNFPSRANVDRLLAFLATKTGHDPASQKPVLSGGELDHAQRYTSGLLGSVKDAQFTVNELGLVTDLNEAFGQLCGRRRDEILGKEAAALFVNPAGLALGLNRGMSKGKISGEPQRIKLSSSESVSVLLNAMAYRDRVDGMSHGLLVCAHPVSPTVFSNVLQSQSYARGLIEASLDLLVFLDLDGTVLDVNETAVKMTGVPREGLVGSDFRRYFDSPDEASRGISLTLSEGQVRNFELELLSANGELYSVQFNACLYRNTEGAVQGIFAAARDIREQKATIANLRAAQAYSRGLIESGLDLMVTVDADGLITDVNATATELTGRSREALIGGSFVDFFDDPERASHGVTRCFRDGLVRNFELQLKGARGEPIPVSFNASVYCGLDGSIQGIFGVARDIRERLKMIRDLESARDRARSLIEECPDMVVMIDRDGGVTEVNQAAVRLTGKPRERLVGSHYLSHFAEPERARDCIGSVYSDGLVSRFELELLGEGGDRIPVSLNASRRTDADGRVTGVVASARPLA